MDINQKIAIITKAIEMGAYIEASFHRINGKAEAEAIASEFSEMLNVPFTEKEHTGSYWFKLNDHDNKLEMAVFYEFSNKEKKELLQKQLDELKQDEEAQA